MNFIDALHISASGLTSQRLRMNVVSSNIANSHTTRTPEGGPYRRKDVVFSSQPVRNSFQDMMNSQLSDKLSEVRVVEIVEDSGPPVLKYDPQHPDADGKGFVRLPNINMITEMVNMMSATRSYEANVTAVKATKNMAQKALEIGK
ncbi:MAG: flagellar basal body rod protein FlgC [Deltaproteobacteria bacterium]|jgi:flagellar basal-body rod protein FlgC|nr:flagellar basal body rod protein FlgC [Deltaproteobacteria bacterium]MBW2143148.1 flagellar basal body rod protein FlgC [Deltaproteobacteria bacterium]